MEPTTWFMSPKESTCSSSTDVSGPYRRCPGQHTPLFRFLGSLQTSKRLAKQITGYSKTEPPFSRIRSSCLFDDTNFEAYEVPLDSGTKNTQAPQFEPRTSWYSSQNTIDWDS